ncbi:MAG: prolipoprotein diacylglyceryl transferase [Spirochaetes bacterium]|nr:prolipoprotein diacylglyceryl transferase [Spirochaetota bacterium]
MHPILFQFQILGKTITIASYGLMAVTGISIAIAVTLLVARRFRYDLDDVFNYALLTAVGGILGAFVVGFVLFLPERISYGFFRYPPALVSWGGLLGGLTAIQILRMKWGVRVLNLADIVSPGFFIGLGIGRIGCFLAGCCYGKTTSLPIGITFTHPIAPASHSVQPLLPVQLISAATLITIGIIFIPLARARRTPGSILTATLLVYPVFRFIIEFFRDDPRSFFAGFSDGQLFSIAAFLLGLIIAQYLRSHRGDLSGTLLSLHRSGPPEE